MNTRAITYLQPWGLTELRYWFQTDGPALYTDGSNTEEGTGAGVFCEQVGMTDFYMLNGKCRVLQADIFAILKVSELI